MKVVAYSTVYASNYKINVLSLYVFQSLPSSQMHLAAGMYFLSLVSVSSLSKNCCS